MSDLDARLVERARAGDAEAFEQLVRRHLRAAHAVALAVTGETADAEDVCQDAWLTVLERLDECRDPTRFAAWLLRIVRHRALNLRRYQKVRAAQPLEAAAVQGDGADPARDAERSMLRSRLQIALAELPEVQREVILLHDLEGWKHREIAAALDMPEGTVRAHVFHARRALRRLLGASLSKEG